MYLPAEQRRYTSATITDTLKAVRSFMHALPISASDVGIDLDVLTSVEAELFEYRKLRAVEEGGFIEGQYDEDDEIETAPGAVPVCTECDSDNDVQPTGNGGLCWACRKERGIGR